MSKTSDMIKAIATGAVIAGLQTAAASPSNDLKQADVQSASKPVVAQVEKAIEHLTNNEPWYQSRVTVGNYVAMASTVLGPLLGLAVDADDQALITSVITGVGVVAGAALSLYGRWKAKKPLGA